MVVVKGTYFVVDNQLHPIRDEQNILLAEAMNLTVDNHALHYGDAAFEGIRAERTQNGRVVVQLEAHLDRLFAGVEALQMGSRTQISYVEGGRQQVVLTREQMREQILDAIQLNFPNGEGDIYIRPIVYRGQGLAVSPMGRRPHYAIIVQQWSGYVHSDAMFLSACTRPAGDNGPLSGTSFTSFWPGLKISGFYVPGVMAKGEAVAVRDSKGQSLGISEPLMLNRRGGVAEASGACIIVSHQGQFLTPTLEDGVLDSITRRTAMALEPSVMAASFGLEQLLQADEVRLMGTAAGITAPMVKLYAIQSRVEELVDARLLPVRYLDQARANAIPARIHSQSGEHKDHWLLRFDLRTGRGRTMEPLARAYDDFAHGRHLNVPDSWLKEVPRNLSAWGQEQQRQVRERMASSAHIKDNPATRSAGGVLAQR